MNTMIDCSLVAQPPRDVSELYHELLYAVARKFPGESRHETALRYIRDTEERARKHRVRLPQVSHGKGRAS